mgnify:CR=1 FL=1
MKELPTVYQSIIHRSRYSRYLYEEKRRETWEETVDRLLNYLYKKTNNVIDEATYTELKVAVLNLDVMPSMRLLMTAGEACERENIAAYNCSYLAVNNKRAFSECLYILMCGTGVGFSCERQEVNQLPAVPKEIVKTDDLIVVADSKRGWALAFKKLLSSLWEGEIPTIDYSKIRPAGARLKVFGGRASGPVPLKQLFDFTITTFQHAKGRKLQSIEVHDLMCMIGEIVVVGGVRRSALISLSNLTDTRMREAKTGAWWENNKQRALANNSVCYTEKPDVETFLDEWTSLVKSKSGERGIFNRVAAQAQASKWGRRSADKSYGCNPCSEILLRDKQFCNLTEVVVRSEDTYESLKRKVELATILGTIQSTLTDFGFLSEEWIKNTEEERLLGVSLTGIMDNEFLNSLDGRKICKNKTDGWYTLSEILSALRQHARDTNEKWANMLGIPVSAAITCVKPSGTVSQLVNSASGIHARHNPYYIRRIRMDKKDPMYQFLKDKGLDVEDDVRVPETTAVFSFPMKAPEGAICRKDRTALEQLELWLVYQRHWCEHKPSITVSVKDEEWPEVGAWIWKHFDEVSGISFLPFSDYTYQQAPYEDITEEQYHQMMNNNLADINWMNLIEQDDNTEGAQTLACSSGNCEI